MKRRINLTFQDKGIKEPPIVIEYDLNSNWKEITISYSLGGKNYTWTRGEDDYKEEERMLGKQSASTPPMEPINIENL